ncbi:MAG: hypothetical protein HYZ84_06815 [Candidatus Omnitrophica bacterium]|nr:hypothetical protein [Candidatus Omnitrophota bacterium]
MKKFQNIVILKESEGRLKNLARSFGPAGLGMTMGLCLFLLSGCRIEFHAQSIVRDDGSIERSTSYRAQDKSDREELSLRYELPEGGDWKDTPVNIFKFLLKGPEVQMLSSYETKRVIPAGSGSVSDFKRFTLAKDKAATNAFRVRVKNWWVVKWFDYEERFTDVIDPAKIKLVIDRVMEKGLATFQTELGTRLGKPELVDRIIPEVKSHYEGLLNRYYDLVSEKGWDFKGVEELSQEVQKEFTSESASKFLTEKFPELDNEPSRKAISEAFHATGAMMDTWLSQDAELQAYGQDIFGVHGFPVFQAYDFKVGVKMPGRILRTNAGEKNGGMQVWQFSAENLTQVIHVESRKVYPVRIVIAGAVLFLLFLFLTRLGKPGDAPKPKKKNKK